MDDGWHRQAHTYGGQSHNHHSGRRAEEAAAWWPLALQQPRGRREKLQLSECQPPLVKVHNVQCTHKVSKCTMCKNKSPAAVHRQEQAKCTIAHAATYTLAHASQKCEHVIEHNCQNYQSTTNAMWPCTCTCITRQTQSLKQSLKRVNRHRMTAEIF